MIIFPAIDIKNGNCVRLRQGRADQETVYGDDPAAMGRRWQEEGAAWLHVVDLDGAFQAAPGNLESIRRLRRAVSIPIQLGGGIRTLDTMAAYLEIGIDRLILGTAVLKDPDLTARALTDFPGRIALGLDARDSLLAVERLLQRKVPYDDAKAQLLIQLDGNRREAVDADAEVVSELCLQHGARDVLVAQDRPTRDRLWEARRMIIESLTHESPINHMEDLVVPRAEIPVLLKGIKEIAERQAVRIVSFGHAGDGNVHVNVLKDDLPDDRWEALVPAVEEETYRLTLSLGGTLTGEHGIGATRRRYLPLALDDAQIEVMRGIRAVFDPDHILNPGKIFP